MDPDVENEAWRIARYKVEQSLKSQEYDLADVGEERINALTSQTLRSYPILYDEAKKKLDEEASD
jgi:hypothetical protein